MLWVLYVAAMVALYWIYDGYGRFLRWMVLTKSMFNQSSMLRQSTVAEDVISRDECPTVTVLLTVHNEQSIVEQRVRNVLACRYPSERLTVVVASDGSTDSTGQIVRNIGDSRIRLIETPGLGKTATQNEALKHIDSDVVLFTDADTRFDEDFVSEIVKPFDDATVGAVDGRLLYTDPSNDAIVQGQGFYWNYELGVRHAESQLGLLAVLTGASFAVRRQLLRMMEPSIGEDCIVPLDVVSQGFQVVHQPRAKAYDSFEEGNGVTFKRRVRMTLRNWQGTWSRPQLLNPLANPGYAFALWSHKLLRWMSPVFLIVASITAVWLFATDITIATTIAIVPIAGLLGLATAGALPNVVRGNIPLSGTAFTFVLANAAFFVGVIRAISGQQIRSYQTVVDSEPNPSPGRLRSAT